MHPFNPLLLRHPRLPRHALTVLKLPLHPHTANWNSTHSTWIHQPDLHLHTHRDTHRHTQTAPSWESHWQIPLLNVYRCWCIFHPPAPLFTPSLTFLFFLISSWCRGTQARRECYCNAEWFIQDCKYWQWWRWWLLLVWSVLSWGAVREKRKKKKTPLPCGFLTDKVSSLGWSSGKSFYIPAFVPVCLTSIILHTSIRARLSDCRMLA